MSLKGKGVKIVFKSEHHKGERWVVENNCTAQEGDLLFNRLPVPELELSITSDEIIYPGADSFSHLRL